MGEAFDDGGQSALYVDTPAGGQQSGCDALPADAGAWLWITFEGGDASPDHPPTHPEHVGHIVVGDHDRSAADDLPERDGSASVAVDAVADPTDLDSLGTAIGRYLRQWKDKDLAICFDSITDLLSHVDEESALQFLGLFVDQLEKADAVAHFHLDAENHDDATVDRIAQLVDVVEQLNEHDRPAAGERHPDDSDRHGGDEPTQEEVHERLQRVTDGGEATDVTDNPPKRTAPADIDEATDQEIAERYADL